MAEQRQDLAGTGFRLILEGRIIDGWAGLQAERYAWRDWLRHLTFLVNVSDDMAQIGPACGYVAARATNLMFAADGWRGVDVRDAVDRCWYELGNEVLENGKTNPQYLETQHVYELVDTFHEMASTAPPAPHDPHYPYACTQWPLRISNRQLRLGGSQHCRCSDAIC